MGGAVKAPPILVYARQLQAGDVTTGSQQKVLSATPMGKRVQVELETRKGATRTASWNASTRLHVFRPLPSLEEV
jgi:hypothetical protein